MGLSDRDTLARRGGLDNLAVPRRDNQRGHDAARRRHRLYGGRAEGGAAGCKRRRAGTEPTGTGPCICGSWLDGRQAACGPCSCRFAGARADGSRYGVARTTDAPGSGGPGDKDKSSRRRLDKAERRERGAL
ncbi:hypothetical protein SDC9_198129 [bioreactor metagenome]|uniref:Uncharacterized protein n=1 Tax=bioreactor metagenome TaxID=1076179 RepID=A0A645II38_9ZZZZ